MATAELGTLASGPVAGRERLHALDAVRAGALLLGVVFHATMSFVPGQQIWLTRDAESPVLAVLFFVSHVFRMALFFMIAGFFGRMSCERLGTKAFVRDRLRRIGIPLVGFWPLSVVSITAAFIWGVVTQYGVEGAKGMEPPKTSASIVDTFPLTHLWFLYVLLGLYAATLALRWGIGVLDRGRRLPALVDRALDGLVRSGLAPVALAVPTAAVLYGSKNWLLFFGVPTPDHGLVPNAAAATAFGVAFAFGWLLQRRAGLLRVLERRYALHLAAAVGLSAVCLWITGLRVVLDPVRQPGAQDPWRLVFALGYPLATWTWALGLVGAAMRFLSRPNDRVRYLADASYWIYLIHLPIVMALQVLVFHAPLPGLVKFALVLAVGFPLMPLSYHLLVRYTWVGALLSGRRRERPGRAAAAGAVLSGATE
jgi:peptidoglycan/LPS O-acetylase OafA/YrhL